MLRAQYSQGKSAARAKFAALLSPQEEQAFGYGNAAQRANQVHGVADQHVAGRGGNHGAFQAADDAALRASAGSAQAGTTANQRPPVNKNAPTAAHAPVAAGGTQAGIKPIQLNQPVKLHPAHVPSANSAETQQGIPRQNTQVGGFPASPAPMRGGTSIAQPHQLDAMVGNADTQTKARVHNPGRDSRDAAPAPAAPTRTLATEMAAKRQQMAAKPAAPAAVPAAPAAAPAPSVVVDPAAGAKAQAPSLAPGATPIAKAPAPGANPARREGARMSMQRMGINAQQLGQKAWANPWARGAGLLGGGLAAGGLIGHMMTGNDRDERHRG